MNLLEKTASKHLVRVQVRLDDKEESSGSGVVFTEGTNTYCLTAYHCIYGTTENPIECSSKDEIYIEKSDEYGKLNHRFEVLDIMGSSNSDSDDWLLLNVSLPKNVIIDELKYGNPNGFLGEFYSTGFLNKLKKEEQPAYFHGKVKERYEKRFNIQSDKIIKLWSSDKEHAKGLSGSGVYTEFKDEVILLGILCEVLDDNVTNDIIRCVPIDLLKSQLDSNKFVHIETLPIEQLQKKAKEVSNDINQIKPNFGYQNTAVINRKEVDEIVNWIETPYDSKKTNIAVVAGDAGMGKTVLVAQLYNKLCDKKIPVLCLKADRLAFDTREELEKEINLGLSIYDFASQLIKENKQIVLIIDQIDALSQTLSSNRKPLSVYNRLIQKFTANPSVKIVISCRVYDLNNDPLISNYKDKKSFVIPPLTQEQVIEVLQKTKQIEVSSIPNTLLELLKTPLHLDVFLKVYSKEVNLNQITSIQDLYEELWRQRIVRNSSGKQVNITFKDVPKLISAITDKMYNSQKINVSVTAFEDEYTEHLDYLKTEGILKGNESKSIEFFHQSFFDYAYARNFVQKDKALVEDIKSRHQGLFIRSKVKQILNYKRIDTESYIEDVNRLLNNKDIRFHIQLLSLQQIAFQASPNKSEQQLIKRLFKQNRHLKEVFLSLYLGNGWLKIIIDNKLLEEEIKSGLDENKELVRRVLVRFVDRDNKLLIQYLFNIRKKFDIDDIIVDVLWAIREIDDKLTIELIEQVKYKFDKDTNRWFYQILSSAVTHFPDWVAQQVISLLDINRSTVFSGKEEYFPSSYTSLYKSIWEKYPRKSYLLVKRVIHEIIKKKPYGLQDGKEIQRDKVYRHYERKNLSLYYHYQQLDKLQSYLEEEFNQDSDFVKKEVKEYLASNYMTLNIIGVSVIQKHSAFFLEESFALLSNEQKLIQVYGLNSYMTYLLLDILTNSYSDYTLSQKSIINDVIDKFYLNDKLVFTNDNGEKIQNKFYGLSKYQLLSALPENERNKNVTLKKQYQELERKFGKRENEQPEGVVVSRGGRTMKASAYENMTDKHWKNSFKKYHKRSTNPWGRPDEIDHGRTFASYVGKNPSKFIDLVDEILSDNTIPQAYKVKGLEGLKQGNIDKNIFTNLFIKAIDNNEFNEGHTFDLIQVSQFFSDNQIINNKVLSFLKQQSINGNEKSGVDEKDYFNVGYNSVRGFAVSHLMDYHFTRDTIDYVFNTLDQILDSSPSTRACVMPYLPNFLRHNPEKVLKAFLKLSHDYDIHFIKESIYPLQYLVNYNFQALIPFFEKNINAPNSHETLGHLLTQAYCFEYKGADELLDKFVSLGDKQINSSVKIALEFIEHEVSIHRAIPLLERFLDNKDKDIGQSYAMAFYHFKESTFPSLLDFLYKYTCSEVGCWKDDAFYEYLLKCSNDYSHDCIKLVGNFIESSNSKEGRMIGNKPINVLIHSYNAIREYDKKDKVLEQAMDVFDQLLQIPEFKRGAFQVLDKVDKY